MISGRFRLSTCLSSRLLPFDIPWSSSLTWASTVGVKRGLDGHVPEDCSVVHVGYGDGAGDQEWVRRQKARKARRKKTVDTRATKGRKLRYQVHEKLQNFMVPVRTSRGVWHDEQIDELFASLLGS